MLGLVERRGESVEFVPEPFQVGDGLLEDVAEDVDVDELGGFLVGLLGGLEGRPVVVVREFLEEPADLVGDG